MFDKVSVLLTLSLHFVELETSATTEHCPSSLVSLTCSVNPASSAGDLANGRFLCFGVGFSVPDWPETDSHFVEWFMGGVHSV
jgi:hypothetical protein